MIERIENWEECSLCQILFDLQKAFDILSTTEIYPHNCQSGVWIQIKLIYEGRRWGVSGSTVKIVQKRLIDWVDSRGIRDFIKESK